MTSSGRYEVTERRRRGSEEKEKKRALRSQECTGYRGEPRKVHKRIIWSQNRASLTASTSQ